MELLIINNHDYSQFVKHKGFSWSRNDLDSEKTTRTKDGRLRRDKIDTKRQLKYSVMGMTREQLARLDEDLSQVSFIARFSDLHGVMERRFYCASFSAVLSTTTTEKDGRWEAAEFTITEI